MVMRHLKSWTSLRSALWSACVFVCDWSGSQLRNDLEIDKAARGKMKLIHLNTTMTLLLELAYPLIPSKIGFLTVSSLDRQYRLIHQYVHRSPSSLCVKDTLSYPLCATFQLSDQYPIFFPSLSSSPPLLVATWTGLFPSYYWQVAFYN